MWCNNYGQKLVDLRTRVYPRYFVIGFTDFAILWHCTLGRQFILLPIIRRVFFFKEKQHPWSWQGFSVLSRTLEQGECLLSHGLELVLSDQRTAYVPLHSAAASIMRGLSFVPEVVVFCTSCVQPGKISPYFECKKNKTNVQFSRNNTRY